MENIEWKEEWNIDVELIDIQHKILITLLNKIISADNDLNYKESIEGFIYYASDHFLDEEQVMIINDYPQELLMVHKEEHNKFRMTLLDISFNFIKSLKDEKSREETKAAFIKLCFDWFEKHFLTTDRKFAEFLNNN